MSLQIVLTCPHCGSKDFTKMPGGAVSCAVCGVVSYFDEMIPELRSGNTIRVPIKNGTLVACKGSDPNYPSVGLYYETQSGCAIDIVTAEPNMGIGGENIDVYLYEDVWDDDFTQKFTLYKREIDDAVGEVIHNDHGNIKNH